MSILEEMFDDERQNLNERPYSRTRSAVDSIKGSAKGLVGSGQVEQGAQEIGQQANQLWNDFKRYVGRKYGNQPKSVTYQDVANFFKGNQLDVAQLGANQNRSFQPKDVGQAILKAVRASADNFADNGDTPPTPPPRQNPPTGGNGNAAGNPPAGGNPPTDTVGDLQGRISSLSREDREKLIRLIS